MKTLYEIIYDTFMYPFESLKLKQVRKKLITGVKGQVLEIGVGTGANLSFYRFKRLKQLTLMDLTIGKSVKEFKFTNDMKVNYVEGNVEKLPFESQSFDYVIFTLVFCSVKNPIKGLEEIKRVLKPNGKILFIEHVLPSNPKTQHIFHLINPTWNKIANGCNINRRTLNNIKKAGFKIISYKKFFRDAFIAGIGEKLSYSIRKQV